VVGGELLADGLGRVVMADATMATRYWAVGAFRGRCGCTGQRSVPERGRCWCCAVAALSWLAQGAGDGGGQKMRVCW
jgi:hypothetical protein